MIDAISSLPGSVVGRWMLAAVAAVVVAGALGIALRVARERLAALAQATDGHLDDVVVGLVAATRTWVLLLTGAVVGAQLLDLPPRAASLIGQAFTLVAIIQVGLWASAALGTWLRLYSKQNRATDGAGVTTAAILGFTARLVVWSVVVLMLLDNLGVDITALMASLGIGGIAVALAAQHILQDLFASLAIALDKPVVIGDFIILGQEMGTVERIGLKTSHLRSLSGELIIVPNNDLLSSRVRNYKRMYERRVVFTFDVVYATPVEKLREIPGTVRDIVQRQEGVRMDRAHFSAFGESALTFEVVYFVGSPDYNAYMDAQQAINLGILAELGKAGISFAYPTRTVYLAAATAYGDAS